MSETTDGSVSGCWVASCSGSRPRPPCSSTRPSAATTASCVTRSPCFAPRFGASPSRRRAWVACGGLGAAALRGSRSGRPGRIVDELQRGGVRNPLFVLDEVGRLDGGGARRAARPGAGRGVPRLLSRPAARPVRSALRGDRRRPRFGPGDAAGTDDRYRAVRVHRRGKRAVATRHLLPLQLARHRLTADDVHVTGEAIDVLIRGYTREAGVWELAGALGAVCGKVVRRRAEGDAAPVEVTPATLAEMLGPPEPAGRDITGRTGRPGVALGLCRTKACWRGGVRRSEPDAQRRCADADRAAGRGHAGVGADGVLLAAGQRRTLRPRPSPPCRPPTSICTYRRPRCRRRGRRRG